METTKTGQDGPKEGGRPLSPMRGLIGAHWRVLNVFERYPIRNLTSAANKELPAVPISQEQLALIGLARTQVGLDDQGLRDLLFLADGVPEARQLSELGFKLTLRGLKLLGFVAPGDAKPFGRRKGMANETQISYIRATWHRIAFNNSAEALDAWLFQRFGVSSLRFCTLAHAVQAIEALIELCNQADRARDFETLS